MKRPTRTRRVLLAEDDPIQAELALATLEEAGFVVEAVANGIDARRRLAETVFDAAVIDVNMPGADGLTLVGEARAGGPNAATPVIIMTGQDDLATTRAAYQLGASSFISKPIDWMEFARKVELVMKGADQEWDQADVEERLKYWLARAGNAKATGDA